MKKIYFLFLIILTFAVLGVGEAKAIGNVYGWAWSENIGWVSFNKDGYGSIPAGGGVKDYGVNIGSGGNISGYAWSENIGWITFNQADLSGCPNPPCIAKFNTGTRKVSGWARALSAPTAGTNAGGWDGWISLDNIAPHQMYVDSTPNAEGLFEFHEHAFGGNPDNEPQKSVIGWTSFNCAEGGSSGGNICGTSNYKVVTTFSASIDGECNPAKEVKTVLPPSGVICLKGLASPAVPVLIENGNNDYWEWTCVGSATPPVNDLCQAPYDDDANQPPHATPLAPEESYCPSMVNFKWRYSDPDNDQQKKYQIQISNSSDFSDIIYDACTDDGCETPIPTYSRLVPVSILPTANCGRNCEYINYNTSYYWRVRVWDATTGANPEWTIYEDANKNPIPFRYSLAHPSPFVQFTSELNSPGLINGKDFATLTDDGSIENGSTCYTYTPPNSYNSFSCTALPPGDCYLGKCYSWWFDYGRDPTTRYFDMGQASNEDRPYTQADQYTTRLQICDEEWCCAQTKSVTVKPPLKVPDWKEVSPF